MRTLTPSRLSMLICLAAAPLCAQTPPLPVSAPQQNAPAPATLPATTPTTAEQPSPLPPAQTPASRAKITYLDHHLTVIAQNSSLNQILREISQITGITITGGVAEERVFGSYGPDIPSQVLGQLLDGTGSNVLFVSSIENKPAELILTPRGGGPTPPNPNAMRANDNADAEDTPVDPSNNPSESVPGAAPASTPPGPLPGAPASSTDDQQSPNGTRTPQQIYDQLMKLRQQQQQQQPH
jgi:hypothetical protein